MSQIISVGHCLKGIGTSLEKTIEVKSHVLRGLYTVAAGVGGVIIVTHCIIQPKMTVSVK